MIDKLIKPVSDILDKFVADKDLKLKLSHELEKEIVSLNRAQIELNKVEASHQNIFVSGITSSQNENIVWQLSKI